MLKKIKNLVYIWFSLKFKNNFYLNLVPILIHNPGLIGDIYVILPTILFFIWLFIVFFNLVAFFSEKKYEKLKQFDSIFEKKNENLTSKNKISFKDVMYKIIRLTIIMLAISVIWITLLPFFILLFYLLFY